MALHLAQRTAEGMSRTLAGPYSGSPHQPAGVEQSPRGNKTELAVADLQNQWAFDLRGPSG
jgi:hypothetical protein